MQTEGDQLYAKKLISNISAGSGSLVATSIAEGPVAASTPPRGRECRRAKRLREQSAESEWIDHDTPVSALGSSQHLNWVKPLAGYIVTWLNSFCEHHSLCRAIPREVVVRLTIAIYR